MDISAMIIPVVEITGTVAIIAVCITICVSCVRLIVRFFTEARYAMKLKYYVEDSRERIIEYDKRIKAIEEKVAAQNRRANDEH